MAYPLAFSSDFNATAIKLPNIEIHSCNSSFVLKSHMHWCQANYAQAFQSRIKQISKRIKHV